MARLATDDWKLKKQDFSILSSSVASCQWSVPGRLGIEGGTRGATREAGGSVKPRPERSAGRGNTRQIAFEPAKRVTVVRFSFLSPVSRALNFISPDPRLPLRSRRGFTLTPTFVGVNQSLSGSTLATDDWRLTAGNWPLTAGHYGETCVDVQVPRDKTKNLVVISPPFMQMDVFEPGCVPPSGVSSQYLPTKFH